MRTLLAFLLLCLMNAHSLLAQAVNDSGGAEMPPKTASPPPVPSNPRRSVDLRVDRTLVLINVTVTDPLNRFVTGLDKEHFRLFEDKVEQEILEFSSRKMPPSQSAWCSIPAAAWAPNCRNRAKRRRSFSRRRIPSDEFFLSAVQRPARTGRAFHHRYRQDSEHADVYPIKRPHGSAWTAFIWPCTR